jgi:hypothetical protein
MNPGNSTSWGSNSRGCRDSERWVEGGYEQGLQSVDSRGVMQAWGCEFRNTHTYTREWSVPGGCILALLGE